MPFNEGQLKAIQQRNSSILVSAPAGSGKTKILVSRIIELLKDNSRYKTAELAEMLDISRKTVSIKLKNLREKGIIERVGSDRKGYWNIYL